MFHQNLLLSLFAVKGPDQRHLDSCASETQGASVEQGAMASQLQLPSASSCFKISADAPQDQG